ncbi:tripartite tricarboxylate transporter substrate binding protein [Roseomonas sp. PWR1]|uniref:Tripartite tricarboxylate transporter substrate binding protein n=1 Tax=Roseomonas nitratireducens TaxID=2820810 RepID=A0ABS4AQ34_9PROT|nr:tripartite tricarboxylate transporter substrate binding protein [Neoroseomonas nitratireducens]MBP0463474.1 tripartite tricarboxylate transporter substrate binding protein [Neoroseomonas nitratireducens]
MRRALLLLALLAPLPATAFPDRPVTIINPYATGSSTDAAARALADSFTRDLGQNVVVTSQSGGSGVVGMRALTAAAPDGHTLAYSPLVPLAFQPHLVRNTGLGPDAVAPVCNVTENILGIMVKADSPWRTLADMVAAARQRPLTYGSPGPNSAPFLGVHRVQSAAGGQFTHVPFRGDGASLTEVIAGRLDFAAIVVASGVPMARAGQTRLVAVFSEGRHPAFPDVPTAREQGIDALQPSYAGLFAPRGTPEPVLARLEAACRAAMETDGFRRFAENWGAVASFRGRAELQRLLTAEYEATGAAFRALGVTPE